MTALLSLPNELFLAIYACSPTLGSAACFSAVNKRLHSIWLRNIDTIAEATLSPQIPSYEDAVELAILEETLINNIQPSPTDGKVSIHLYGARLLCIADVASFAATEWDKQIAELHRDIPEEGQSAGNYTSPHTSYYFVRKILCSRRHPEDAQLRHAIVSTIRSCSEEAIYAHEQFAEHLLNGCPVYLMRTLRTEEERNKNDGISEDEAREDGMPGDMGTCVDIDEFLHVQELLDTWPGYG